MFVGANFRGNASRPSRRNIRGFYFRGVCPPYHTPHTYVRTLRRAIRDGLKFSWFLFSLFLVGQRKPRKFAPHENFPLYGIQSMHGSITFFESVKSSINESNCLNSSSNFKFLASSQKYTASESFFCDILSRMI